MPTCDISNFERIISIFDNFMTKFHELPEQPSYLVSNDLSWRTHINRITTNANKSIGYLRRTKPLKEKAYKAMVRPQLEYAAPVWDPHIPRRYSENWNGSQAGSSVGLRSLFTILKCVRYARPARLANSRAASLWLTTGPLLQDRSLLYHPMSSH